MNCYKIHFHPDLSLRPYASSENLDIPATSAIFLFEYEDKGGDVIVFF